MKSPYLKSLCCIIVCLLVSSCGVSCVESRRGKVENRVTLSDYIQIVSLNIKEGSEFVVNTIIDLHGVNAVLPDNVLISFKKGGSIVNGCLTGNRTRINSRYENVLGVVLKGSWQVDKISDMAFSKEYLSDAEILSNINTIQSDDFFNEISIDRDYMVTITKQGGCGILMSSNSSLVFSSTLTVLPNNYKSYYVIQIKGKHNIKIRGGRIVGDVGNHTYVEGTTSEWGMGVNVDESKCVTLENLFITKCIGDGINVTGGNEEAICQYVHASKDVFINNVICDDNRRQGLSIIHVDGLNVLNCSFINTGMTEQTSPSAGIDFEPNVTNGRNNSIRNVQITNCHIYGNKGKQLGSFNAFYDGTLSSFESIRISNTIIDGICYVAGDMVFEDCKIQSIVVRNAEIPVNTVFRNCIVSDGEGVCMIVSKPTSNYQIFKKNRDYSVCFDNCVISISDNYYNEKLNGLIVYKGNSNVYNGELRFSSCTLTLPVLSHPNMYLFCRGITGDVFLEHTTINAIERPLDIAGASYNDCTFNCAFIQLNTTRFGKDRLKKCIINASSNDKIFYMADNSINGEGYDIQDCVINSPATSMFISDGRERLRSTTVFVRNKFIIKEE